MVAVPEETALVRPLKGAASLTSATPVSDEVQVAHMVRFCLVLLLSDKVPVAANCMVVPGAMLGGAGGETSIEAT